MRRALDYKNGKIYVIKNHINDMVYVGSTTQPLYKRFSLHKRSVNSIRCRAKKISIAMRDIGIEHFYIELLEEYPCDNIEQLHKREGYWIRELNSYSNGYNAQVQGRNRQEYYQEHKERHAELVKNWYERNKNKVDDYHRKWYQENKGKILERQMQYYQDNKHDILQREKKYRDTNREKIREWMNTKVECEVCNISFNRSHLSKHQKTKRHISQMLN
jgi:hypothetical protein